MNCQQGNIKKSKTKTLQDFCVAQMVNNLSAMQETQAQFLGQENPLEPGMATHSSVLKCTVT